MIKTLRITSFVAVILAVVFFVFPVIFGVRGDEQVEQFLSSPGVIEKFSKAKGDKDRRSESQISPLVKEAQAFALYLNPPPKKTEPRPIRKKTTPPRPQGPVSPKFELIGVSYYASHPELSLALIDEPGKGTRWVRQSSRVGHLIIEQVKDGLVVVRDGERTFELEPKRREERSLVIKGSSSGQTGSKSTPMPSTGADAAVKSDKAPRQLGAEAEEEIASLKKTINGLKAIKADADIEEFVSDLEAEIMRISAEEAKRLNDLGKELKDIQQDPNRADDNITESDANLSEPNLSDANLGDANLSEANSPEEE